MKRLLLLASVLMIVSSVCAQATFSIGYIYTSSTYKDDIMTKNDNYNGLLVGFDYNINLAGSFSVAPGLEMDFSYDKDEDVKYKEFGFFVPIDFNYGFELGSDVKLSVFAGPSLYMGLVAKEKGDMGEYDYYDDNQGNCSRFDLKLGGGAWVTLYDQFRLKIGYKAGLLDVCRYNSVTSKDNLLTISLGYIF